MAVSEDGEARARRAFEHAVAREQDGIELHERAMRLHDARAEQLDDAGTPEEDPTRVADLTPGQQQNGGRLVSGPRAYAPG